MKFFEFLEKNFKLTKNVSLTIMYLLAMFYIFDIGKYKDIDLIIPNIILFVFFYELLLYFEFNHLVVKEDKDNEQTNRKENL